MYAFKIEPINGRMMWANPYSHYPTKLLPQKHHVPIGRPKKKRRRSATEDDSSIGTRTVSCKGQAVGGLQASGSDVGQNASVGHNSANAFDILETMFFHAFWVCNFSLN
uniref:Uncharacterized protein n=1 Tax=Lactuca sativa TaxID=4236 RepID=A0A9R1VL36_LACSA|nr:hypothetical protein LSAT_V11C500253330 [Lactuca sativa]